MASPRRPDDAEHSGARYTNRFRNVGEQFASHGEPGDASYPNPLLLAIEAAIGDDTPRVPGFSACLAAMEKPSDERTLADEGELLKVVKTVRVFRGMSRSRLIALTRVATLQRVLPNTAVCFEGETGDSLSIVLLGRFKVLAVDRRAARGRAPEHPSVLKTRNSPSGSSWVVKLRKSWKNVMSK